MNMFADKERFDITDYEAQRQRCESTDRLLQVIMEHGLSIRMIPKEIVSRYSMTHHKEGNDTVEIELNKDGALKYHHLKMNFENKPHYRFDDKEEKVYRTFSVSRTVPEHAGYWMCKKEKTTGSNVSWNKKTDNLAKTLEESINLFLEKI